MAIAKFDPVEVLEIIAVATPIVTFLVQFLKKWAEKFGWDWVAHGKGPVILAGIVALFATVLPEIAQDGKLTVLEIGRILEILGVWGGSGLLYSVARKYAFVKEHTWG